MSTKTIIGILPMSTPSPSGAVRTTCPYCGVGCGLIAARQADGLVMIQGDPEHPANLGRICSKGAALGETVDLQGRLLHPEINGRRVSWDAALDHVAAGFRAAIAEHGPDSVAFYLSGQLLTEDYYVANKLMKGFIGSANVDTNSRLCMSSAVAAHKRTFGSDTVPGCYEDLELADLVVLAGSNTAWCHPVLFQRITAAKERRAGMRVVVIDPRRTATCAIADLHLALRPGADAFLFNGLLAHLHRAGAADKAFVAKHTAGLDEALAAAQASAGSIEDVADMCGLPGETVAAFFRWFAETPRTVTAFSQGINQSSSGTDKVNAIINCHLLTGRIGKPGMGPFSLTGQPNAMGGREVGGLANQLAAHMELGDPAHRERVRAFWGAPSVPERPGLPTVELFRAVKAGYIRALWIMATNPAVSLPEADRVAAALAQCPFVVVSDCVRRTDTTRYAHVLLPALAWGEKDGTVTNSERRISRQRAFLPMPGEARPDWWIVAQVARRLGFTAQFDYAGAVDVFREHAALSALENGGGRDFDLGALAALRDADYAHLQPVQWPLPAARPRGTARMFHDGRFFTTDGKARFVAVQPRLPEPATPSRPTLMLNTGRMRDQWHTMTRTGRSPRLASHATEPVCAIHPLDARRLGLRPGELVRVASPLGSILVPCVLDEGQRPGSVFVPIHWNGCNSRQARVGALIPARVDPISGQPEFKHVPVSVERVEAAWYGFALARRSIHSRDAAYWTVVQGTGYTRLEMAGLEPMLDWSAWARRLLGAGGGERDAWMEYTDSAAARYRGALLRNGRLEGCVFVAPHPHLPPRAWLGELIASGGPVPAERSVLLTGRPGNEKAGGRLVCSCFGVDADRITAAVRQGGLKHPREVGAAMKAGTNCGSCIPEIQALIEVVEWEQAAQKQARTS